MARIMDVVGIINNLDYRPKCERKKCIRSISPKASCNICEEICSTKSLKINKNGIYISESCNFCNECVTHCPTNALVDSGRKFVGSDNKIYLLCQKHKIVEDINNNSRIECLNFLSTKILLNIYNNGFREIHTNLEKCEGCERFHNLDEELNRTNEILDKLNFLPMTIKNDEVKIIVEYVKQAGKIKKDTKIDRRSFFKNIAKDMFGKTYEIAPPAIRVQHWKSTSQILDKWQPNIENISLFKVTINSDRCIQCNACAKMCPQRVWEINGDETSLRQYLCNGCNLCKDICPTKAIEIEENIGLINETAFSKTEKICSVCGKKFTACITEANECPSCVWKKVKG